MTKEIDELKQEYKDRIYNSLYDLQDIIKEAIDEVCDVGYDNDEFHNFLDAYELLVRGAEHSLVKKYWENQEREEKEIKTN